MTAGNIAGAASAAGAYRFEVPLGQIVNGSIKLGEVAVGYMRTGDEDRLRAFSKEVESLRSGGGDDAVSTVAGLFVAVGHPDSWDEFDRRAVRLVIAAGVLSQALPIKLRDLANEEKPGEDPVGKLWAAMQPLGADQVAFDRGVACSYHGTAGVPSPNSVGRYLLALPEDRLAAADVYWQFYALCRLFLPHAPAKVEVVVEAILQRMGPTASLCQLLCEGGPQFKTLAARVLGGIPREDWHRFDAAEALAALDFSAYGDLAAEAAWDLLKRGDARPVAWLLKTLGPAAAAPGLAEYFCKDDLPYDGRPQQLDYVAATCGAKAEPMLLAALESSSAPLRIAALGHLIALNDSRLGPQIAAGLERGLAEAPRLAGQFAALAGRSKLPQFRDRLWELLSHKSKLLREGAAEGLAAGDPAALDRAAGLLAEKSKDLRIGAVRVLGLLKSAEACDVLLNWLPREKDADVRNELTTALREAGTDLKTIFAGMAPVSLDELRERAAAVKSMPSKWVDERELLGADPTGAKGPLLTDGTPLGPDLARYLLRQQAKQTDPIPEAEVAGLYAMIDRRTSGDFAARLLTAYLESGRGKADAWALVVAGMLGDNRVVTTLATQVRKWADSFDQKLGEWGIEALALNGSDAALMAVDSIARRFQDSTRRKHAVIGQAAADAMEKAAKRAGVSMDDLGDRIVPSFGFESGRPRRIEAGERVIEATVGLDFKLAMKDAATGKKVVTVPKAAGPDVQAEFKGLGKMLLEVGKAQSARLEGLMVRQHRWTGVRWKELFLRHPMLLPFAVRLAWGVYAGPGTITSTFRALPDGSLTDTDDEPLDPPPDDAAVGIVHPLDLSPEQINAWRTHLGDYEIEPPFEQIDRPVALVPEGLGAATSYEALRGATVNGMSFRAKAERAGWSRGQSGDGGYIYAYRKRFASIGVDAFVALDGQPAWADPTAVVTLQEVFFLPAGGREDRVESARMRLGDVPAIAFSEAVGDLVRITGRGQASGNAEEPVKA